MIVKGGAKPWRGAGAGISWRSWVYVIGENANPGMLNYFVALLGVRHR